MHVFVCSVTDDQASSITLKWEPRPSLPSRYMTLVAFWWLWQISWFLIAESFASAFKVISPFLSQGPMWAFSSPTQVDEGPRLILERDEPDLVSWLPSSFYSLIHRQGGGGTFSRTPSEFLYFWRRIKTVGRIYKCASKFKKKCMPF